MQPSRKPRRRGTPPTSRTISLNALEFVLRKGRTLGESLESQPAFAALAGRDRGFTRLLLLTTLRRLGQIEPILREQPCQPIPLSVDRVLGREPEHGVLEEV